MRGIVTVLGDEATQDRLRAPRPVVPRQGRSLAQNTLLMLANSTVNAVGGVAFWFLAARTHSTAVVGIATAATALMVLIATISQLGFGVSLIRYGSELGPKRAQRLSAIFSLSVSTSFAISGLYWLLSSPVEHSASDAAFFIGACAGWTFSLLYDHYLMSRCMMGALLVKNLVVALSRLALLFAVPLQGAMALVAVTGVAGAAGALLVGLAVLHRPPGSDADDRQAISLRSLVGYSFWNHWTTLLGMAPMLLMPTLVVRIAGPEQAAVFYIAWSLYAGLLMVPSSLSQTLLAMGAQGPLPGPRPDRWVLLLPLPFAPMVLAALLFLGGIYFDQGWSVLLPLLFGFPAYCRAVLLQTRLRMRGSQLGQAAMYGTSLTVILATSVPLLYLMGAPGASLAWSAGQYVLWAGLRLTVRRSDAGDALRTSAST